MQFHIKYIKNQYIQFLLLDKDTIISMATCSEYIDKDDPLLSRYIGLNLQDLETNEKYRGKGYASKLLDYMISYCRQNGYFYIILDDATEVIYKNKNIYNKFGAYVKDEYDNWVKWNTYNGQVDEQRLILVNE